MNDNFFKENNIEVHFGFDSYFFLKKAIDVFDISDITNIQFYIYTNKIIIKCITPPTKTKITYKFILYEKYILNYYYNPRLVKKDKNQCIMKKQINLSSFKNLMRTASSKTDTISFSFIDESDNNYLKININGIEHIQEFSKEFNNYDYSDTQEDFNDNFYDIDEDSMKWKFGVCKCSSNKLGGVFQQKDNKNNKINIRIGYNFYIEFRDIEGNSRLKCNLPGLLSSASKNKDKLDEDYYSIELDNISDIFKKITTISEDKPSCVIASKKNNYLTFIIPVDGYGEFVMFIDGN